jgi:flagellar biosynthesis protein
MSDMARGGSGQPLRAAALSYDAADAQAGCAPRLVARGQNLLAEQILRRARDSGVPIHQSALLAEALTRFEVDQAIPPSLYVAVAEVLAWAYRLETAAATGTTAPAASAAPGQ